MSTFHLLGNPFIKWESESIELNETLTLRRPNKSELETIRKRMRVLLMAIGNTRNPYEIGFERLGESSDDGGIKRYYNNQEIENGKHHYWLIDSKEEDLSWSESIPLALTDYKILRIFRAEDSSNFYYTYNQTFIYLKDITSDFFYTFFPSLKDDVKNQFLEIHEHYNSLDNKKDTFLKVAARNYLNSFSIPNLSYFRIVALFGILESLLINNNSKIYYGTGRDFEKNRNTITRQLQTKSLFLHRRFSDKLKFEDYFKGSRPETIIKDLYSLRSYAAHGKEFDWAEYIKKLDPATTVMPEEQRLIIEFVAELTRLIIIEGLKNPQELNELREI